MGRPERGVVIREVERYYYQLLQKSFERRVPICNSERFLPAFTHILGGKLPKIVVFFHSLFFCEFYLLRVDLFSILQWMHNLFRWCVEFPWRCNYTFGLANLQFKSLQSISQMALVPRRGTKSMRRGALASCPQHHRHGCTLPRRDRRTICHQSPFPSASFRYA